MDANDLARIHAAGRLVVGGALTLAPGPAGRGWIGDSASEKPTSVYSRALGIRDMALGAGVLQTLGDRSALRPWLIAAIASDAVDLAATLAAREELPFGGRVAAPVVAAGSALFGAYLLTALGD